MMATGKQEKDPGTFDTATVRSSANPNRVIAEGTDDDAFEYVERNFPRQHSEESGPDVTVVTTDGKKHQYVNGEWITPKEGSK